MTGLQDVSPKDLSLIPGRLALGSAMLYHGAGKLAPSRADTHAQMFGQLGLKPGRFWALATGAAEVLAGASALLGFGTRIAALAVLVTQGVAIAKVHLPHGYEGQKGGYEYNLALIALALGLLVAGPGRVSAHEMAEHKAHRRFRRSRMEQLLKLLK